MAIHKEEAVAKMIVEFEVTPNPRYPYVWENEVIGELGGSLYDSDGLAVAEMTAVKVTIDGKEWDI